MSPRRIAYGSAARAHRLATAARHDAARSGAGLAARALQGPAMRGLVYDTLCERCGKLRHCALLAGELVCEACARRALEDRDAALTLYGERERSQNDA